MNEQPTEIQPISEAERHAMVDLGHAAAVLLQRTLAHELADSEFLKAYQADQAKLIIEITLPDHAMRIRGLWPAFQEKPFELKRLIPGRVKHDA